jgi:hypothetical protein
MVAVVEREERVERVERREREGLRITTTMTMLRTI